MIRKTLALLIRALRVDARNFRSHLIRVGLLSVILYSLWFSDFMSPLSGAPGLTLFRILAISNAVFVTIFGVGHFASAIAEEKEERTLGLLKMADVGSLSILLGKWAPRMIAMLLLVIVQVPFTLLSVTLGGVLS